MYQESQQCPIHGLYRCPKLEVEIRPTWKLAWGLYWRQCLIAAGVIILISLLCLPAIVMLATVE